MMQISRIANPLTGEDADRNTSWRYEYYLKDHLGNIRTIFKDTQFANGAVEIAQTSSYYPFGMVMYQNNYYASSSDYQENKYLYNGKELQDDDLRGISMDLYDYGARFYDPAIARWQVIDPLTEKYYSQSSYNYVGNNPIRRIDPDGMKWKDKASKKEAKAAKRSLRAGISACKKYKPTDKKERIAELKNGIKEIKEMGKNKEYTFELKPNNNGDQFTTVNPNDHTEVTMTYDMGSGFIKDDGIRAHELKHGYQAMTGDLNYHPVTHQLTYDQTDELAAYQRQYSVRGILDVNTKSGTTRILNYTDLNLQHVNNMVDKTGSYMYRNYPQVNVRASDVLLLKGGNTIKWDYSNSTFEKL